jgi:hypothetical protein
VTESINHSNKSALTLHVRTVTAECEMSAAANLYPDERKQDFKENMIVSSLL